MIRKKNIKNRKTNSILHTCKCCGKSEQFKENSIDTLELQNCWHILKIDNGICGYGSMFDTCQIQFEICNECLNNCIGDLIFKDEIEFEDLSA